MKRPPAHVMLAGLFVGLSLPSSAWAQIKEYQIARLLNFKTSCEMLSIKEHSPPSGPQLFHAVCQNETFFPDGAEVICPDRFDEWTCRVTTQEKDYKNLELLRRQSGH